VRILRAFARRIVPEYRSVSRRWEKGTGRVHALECDSWEQTLCSKVGCLPCSAGTDEEDHCTLHAVKRRRKDCKNQGKNSIYCDEVLPVPKRDAWWIAEARPGWPPRRRVGAFEVSAPCEFDGRNAGKAEEQEVRRRALTKAVS
jgi:hypothetical protein